MNIHDLFRGQLPPKETIQKEKVSIFYSIIDYLKYEYSCVSDFSKKILEIEIVENYINSTITKIFSDFSKCKTLDIGCATCRYPKYFYKKGFEAHGYDVNETIIELFQEIVGDQISIRCKNILSEKPEFNTYDIITCMMGTFNHIEDDRRDKFANWVSSSLTENGVFICSLWNPQHYRKNFLSVYNKEERQYIKNNLLYQAELERLFEKFNLILDKVEFFCLLDDNLLESWFNYSDRNKIINVDNFLKTNINPKLNSQMGVYFFKKLSNEI